ncbi:hypothetical protein BKA70DRAFT_1426793 [Coprinopsis sp. MPI-PUGE-AT-0042]|nr:hypothetical protein BKA70DRAFT_1426793 [Coprinopsis sp. MPI-PUGE-AT-0042]
MPETAPSPEAIDYYGRTWMASRFATTTLTLLETGISLFMVIYGLITFLETPKDKRKGRGRFIVISCIILITSSITTALDLVAIATTLLNSGPGGRELVRVWTALHEQTWKGVVSVTMLYIYIGIGDCLMIWRCYVVWHDRKWVVIPPILALCGALGCGLGLSSPETTTIVTGALSVSAALLTVSVNVMTTALMIARLNKTRTTMVHAVGQSQVSPMYSNTTAILIESAAPLAVFGVSYAILTFIVHFTSISLIAVARWGIVDDVFALLYYSFCALAPQMIIFRVTTGRSWRNVEESRYGASSISQPLEFSQGNSNRDADRDSGLFP